jgi:tape measure domain-containing protein
MATIGSLIVQLLLNATGFNRQLAVASQAVAKFSGATAAQMRQMQVSAVATGKSFKALAGIGTFVFAARAIANYSDAWQMASNKIAAANTISDIQARSMEGLNDIASRTRTSLADTVELYARLQRSTVGVATSEAQLAKATELVTMAFKAGGASVQEQVNGIRQLSQAISSGIFQGDELRSVRENAPLVAQAIADEFNTTIGGLKKLGAEGKLTADRVFPAILKGAKSIEPAFEATSSTIGDAFVKLNNGIIEYIAHINKATGASKSFATAVGDLGDSFEDTANKIIELEAWKDIISDVGILQGIAAKKSDDLTKSFSELIGVDVDEWIMFLNDEFVKLLKQTNDVTPIRAIAEAFRYVREQAENATVAVKTFRASQGRTGLGAAIDYSDLGGGAFPLRPAPETDAQKSMREQTEEIQRHIGQQKLLQLALTISSKEYNNLKIHIDALNEAQSQMSEGTDEEIRARAQLIEIYMKQQEATERLKEQADDVAQTINSTIGSAISSVSSAFADAVVEGEKFRDVLDALLKDLAKLAINSVMNLLLRQIIGSVGGPSTPGTGLLGGISIPAAPFHSGGIVGSGGGAMRSLPAGMFASAPRFHAGLMTNEFAAVLKKGEGVFTPDQMQALGGKTVNNFTVINQAPNTDVKEERRENSSGGTDVIAIIRQTMTKEVADPASSVHRSMKSTFGLSQAGVRR